MEPRIETLSPKKLIGMSMVMSVAQNTTASLWGGFGPRIREVSQRLGTDKYSLQVYPIDFYERFDPMRTFEKWAAVEVSTYEGIPDGMRSFDLAGGSYAVFDYKGSSADPSIFQYIYAVWLPNSAFVLDDRPHFEVLGPNYKNNDPESEEEIWIPIQPKIRTRPKEDS
ncbi:GyrI-like domain-containing protein [Flagellimonas sp. DF-77]|uniref:GyrI-like domain-containing protein n=1 Tax=Flagellimonas algarum TaxID=3230298 RepID=UPI00339424A4